MSAFLKLFTDSGHTNEVAHTVVNTTTLATAVLAGASQISVASTANWPTSGTIDIIDATGGNETLSYSSYSGTTVNLLQALAHNHASNVTVNEWVYMYAIGDQTNGIPNDGSQSTPTASNTGTWYVYNAGDQTAQSCTFATANTSPTTAAGFSDTAISITSASSGFGASVSPANILAGSSQQIWVAAQVPAGQSSLSNPQQCAINFNYQTV